MKQLKTLIKYHQSLLDEKRKALRAVQDEEDQIVRMKKHLADELVKQQGLVSENVEWGIHYGPYQDTIFRRQEVLENMRLALQTKLDKAQEAVREAYRELKKFELTLERRQEEERKDLERKEQIEADDMTAARWNRQDT